MDSIIEFRNVKKRYDEVVAVDDVSFKVNKKDFIAIIGPNGGGKSTILKLLLKLIEPTEGSILIDNDVKISYVPQKLDTDLSFPISIMDVVLSGRINQKKIFFAKYNEDDIKKANELLKKLNLYDIRHKQIGELSGGQLQKTIIIRALMSDCNVLLLDEPTSSIDSKSKKEIYELLLEINKEITIMMVSHDVNEITNVVKGFLYINTKIHYHSDSENVNHSVCPIDKLISFNRSLIDDSYFSGMKG